jgi:Pyruvate phosphate dikinase, AMP/ATP-binding domain
VVATRADLARLAGDEACANAAAGLDLARHLGRHDAAVDELAGAYAEACELAGRVEDAFSAWVAAADSTADPRTRARRLTRGAVVAWDLVRVADAYQRLDAADYALAGVAVCVECIDVEELRVRFAARSGDLARLDESIVRLAARGRATGSSRWRAATVCAQVVKAVHTGRYVDGLRVADELTALAGNEELVLVSEDLLRLLMAIQMCWGNLVATRASAEEGIRLARPPEPSRKRLAVLVQPMVAGTAAGVAFPANPATGERNRVLIDAIAGLGEQPALGAATPEGSFQGTSSGPSRCTFRPHHDPSPKQFWCRTLREWSRVRKNPRTRLRSS